MDPVQTLPLLPLEERDSMCSHVLACVHGWKGGTRRGLQTCSKAICFSQKVPLSFTDGWACIPISDGGRRAKKNRENKRHLCVWGGCSTHKLWAWEIFAVESFPIECNLHSIMDKKKIYHKIEYIESQTWSGNLLRQAKSWDSFEGISIFNPQGTMIE